jgi:hypothetical protein
MLEGDWGYIVSNGIGVKSWGCDGKVRDKEKQIRKIKKMGVWDLVVGSKRSRRVGPVVWNKGIDRIKGMIEIRSK